jgi:hypothetical protein
MAESMFPEQGDWHPPAHGARARVSRWARILTFRAAAADLSDLDRRDLALGLLATWIVGMGRYWDDPSAVLLQHLGAGSVAYVFVLSLLLWLVIWPLAPAGWSYLRVSTFVSLVAPPAILYAIPIERFTSLATARGVNAWFLAIVAAWRVALLVFFLRRHAQLTYPRLIVGSLLPLTLIVNALVALNLERAVFDIMGGLREPGTSADTAYGVLFTITLFADLAFLPVFVGYLVLVGVAQRERRETARSPFARRIPPCD